MTDQSQTEAPMPNTPEARTTDGTLLDAGAAPTPANPTPAEAPVSAAPETYTDFTAPEGVTLDPAMIAEATPMFKDLGLSQESAQRLVDFHNKQLSAIQQDLAGRAEKMRTEWRDQVKAAAGSKLDSMLVEIGRAKDKLPAEVRQAFTEALDYTGAGDHPAIFRAFYEFSKLVNEGTHVSGAAPSPLGQSNGAPAKPSAAAAMYPHLSR